MPDREKVIEALETCRDQNNPPGYRFTSCVDDCPYHGNGCARKLKEDAISLLKEQEARLYTFDELDHLPNEVDIWCEIKGEDRIFAQTTYDMWFSPYGKFRNAVWNKEIRYWTTRPSKKERKLVGWDA